MPQIILNNRQLYYRESGTGPAVILLHGFGEDGEVWNPLWTAISSYRFIIPDLPGSGQSDAVDDMSMEGLAAVVQELLKHLGIEKSIMIGHSMGGYITLAFVEKYESMLEGFGLFHSSAFADNEEKKNTRKKGIAFIKEHGAFEFLKTATPNLFSPSTKEKKPALIEAQVEAGRVLSAEAMVSYYEAMMARPDRTSLLSSTIFPVLFILGRHDTAVPLNDGLKQSHLPAVSVVHILEDSGHMGMLEETERSIRYVKEYLQLVCGERN